MDTSFDKQMAGKRAVIAARDNSIPTDEGMRYVELAIFSGCGAAGLEGENTAPGQGIISIFLPNGRHYKVEITQVGGPA